MEHPTQYGITIERFRSDDADRFHLVRWLRQTVFVEEQQVPEHLEYEFDEEADNYLIFVDGQAKGTARWRLTGKGVKLERFAVLASERGKGIGTVLLQRVLEDVIPLGQRIYLHAQVTAMAYYLKAGFVVEGPMFTEAGIDHYLMTWPGQGPTEAR